MHQKTEMRQKIKGILSTENVRFTVFIISIIIAVLVAAYTYGQRIQKNINIVETVVGQVNMNTPRISNLEKRVNEMDVYIAGQKEVLNSINRELNEINRKLDRRK